MIRFIASLLFAAAALTAGTTYAFTIRGAAARATGTYAASFSTTAAAYPNGARVGSANSGQTWTIIGSGGAPTPRDLTFKTVMKLAQQIDVAQVLKSQGKKEYMTGKVGTNVELKGVGYTKESLQRALVGGVDGAVIEGKLIGTDLVSGVAQPLSAALPFPAASASGVTP